MSKSDKCKCKSHKRCDCHDRHGCRCGCRRDCGCRGEGGFRRRYRTREERTAALEEYLKELKAEVKAVQEQLADLKKKS